MKPEFFTSGSVTAVSPLARLLFAGLFCEADREGRFQWSPRSLKLRYLPADDVDGQALLDELARERLIVYYEAEGVPCGLVRNFLEHQKIDTREAQSKLPAPPEDFEELREVSRNSALERKGMDRKGRDNLSSLRSERCPSAAGADSDPREPKRQPEQETGGDRQPETGTSKDFAEAFEAWKRTLPEEAQMRVKPTKQRRTKYTARRRDGYTHEQILAAVTNYVNDPWDGRLADAKARDFATLLRDGGQVEKFSAMRPGGRSGPRTTDPRTEADLLLQEAWEHARNRSDFDSDGLKALSESLRSALDSEDPVRAVKAIRTQHAL